MPDSFRHCSRKMPKEHGIDAAKVCHGCVSREELPKTRTAETAVAHADVPTPERGNED